MELEEYKSVANLEYCITRKNKEENNSFINWLKIHWIRIQNDHSCYLLYKEILNDGMLNLRPARSGSPTSLANVHQDVLYPQRIWVTSDEDRDGSTIQPT